MSRLRRGITLLEMLVVVVITALVTAGVARAYLAGVDADARLREGRRAAAADRIFQERLRDLLARAYVSLEPTDDASTFVASAEAPNSVTFSAVGVPPSASLLASEEPFETNMERFGPQGGLTEVSISLTPIGNAGTSSGVFLRQQRPADGDPTQGGFEETLDPDVTQIDFEFYNGTDWQAEWDTRTLATKRIPAAVRVIYRRADDETDRILIVRLPLSDVTSDNPFAGVG